MSVRSTIVSLFNGVSKSIDSVVTDQGTLAPLHGVVNSSGVLIDPATGPTAAVVTGQKAITTTGSAVSLGSNTLAHDVTIKAGSTNAGNIFVGSSGVTTTYDGTGNGYCLEPRATVTLSCTNTNVIYINGNAGDVVSFAGN